MRVPVGVVALVVSIGASAGAADRLVRKPLASDERAAVLALMNAVDLAQQTDVVSSDPLAWQAHVLKSTDLAYVPFQLALGDVARTAKTAALYVRVVSRHDGYRSAEETSALREWVTTGTPLPPARMETVTFGPGELPFGLATRSSRRAVAAPAEASAVLALRQRQYERDRAADAESHRHEANQRDPYRFPFEEYYFFDVKSPHVDRALAVPPGEYDVFAAFMDRGRVKTSSPTVVRHTIAVPDFWNLELRLSSVILVSDVHTLKAALPMKDQIERPYTWGQAEVVPAATTMFGRDDVLSVVYQLCNYGAPDTDVVAEYNFYHQVDGRRVLFNHTLPQELTNDDLPLPIQWETQGFVMQEVPLRPFAPDTYELEIVVRDRLTRGRAAETITFTVK